MLARGSLTVGRLGGIPIRLHFTLLLVLPYLAWGIAREAPVLAQLAGLPVQLLTLPFWALGLLLSLSLFACVLLHELGHVATGLLGGARFEGITLMLVGGVSEMSQAPPRPLAEAGMAVAGPLVSLLLSGLCYLASTAALQTDVRFATFYLAYVNLALACFNLLPAFPMDGGRVLRALLSGITTRLKATRIAAAVGQALALLLIGLGLVEGNWVLALIGLLVIFGARAEVNAVRAATFAAPAAPRPPTAPLDEPPPTSASSDSYTPPDA